MIEENSNASTTPTDSIETKVEQPTVTPEQQKVEQEKVKYSEAFNKLNHKEKDLRVREDKIKEAYQKVAQFEKDQELKVKDPFEWAKKQGINVDELIKLGLEPKTPEAKRLKEVERTLQEIKQREEDSKISQAQNEEAHNRKVALNFVGETVSGAGEEFEILNADPSSYEIVYNRMEEEFKKTGRVPEILDVAKAVEKDLETQVLALYNKLKGVKKINKSPEDNTSQQVEKTKTGEVKDPKKQITLTDKLNTGAKASDDKKLSEKERFEIAAAMIKSKK